MSIMRGLKIWGEGYSWALCPLRKKGTCWEIKISRRLYRNFQRIPLRLFTPVREISMLQAKREKARSAKCVLQGRIMQPTISGKFFVHCNWGEAVINATISVLGSLCTFMNLLENPLPPYNPGDVHFKIMLSVLNIYNSFSNHPLKKSLSSLWVSHGWLSHQSFQKLCPPKHNEITKGFGPNSTRLNKITNLSWASRFIYILWHSHFYASHVILFILNALLL